MGTLAGFAPMLSSLALTGKPDRLRLTHIKAALGRAAKLHGGEELNVSPIQRPGRSP